MTKKIKRKITLDRKINPPNICSTSCENPKYTVILCQESHKQDYGHTELSCTTNIKIKRPGPGRMRAARRQGQKWAEAEMSSQHWTKNAETCSTMLKEDYK